VSENAGFARACRAAGIVFVGPPAEVMEALGSKVGAKAAARAADVPTVPGIEAVDVADPNIGRAVAALGYPVLVKASGGGGGRGMRIVAEPTGLAAALQAARAEAAAAFGDDQLLIERYFPRARHVEVQVLGDDAGVLHFFERECSIQRRHQKIIEESPAPGLDPGVRDAMTAAAVRLCAAVGYRSAGTVEFLLTPEQDFYFLEVNTRLQVEHPVTELVTGYDLVQGQLAIAAGRALDLRQEHIVSRGAAIEARVYAEDPAAGFLPSTGRLAAYHPPAGPGVRVDDGCATGDAVSARFDALLAKVIAVGWDRAAALERLRAALRETVVLGVTTNLAYLEAILGHPAFRDGQTFTRFLEAHLAGWQPPAPSPAAWLAAAAFESMARAATPAGASPGATPGTLDPWQAADSFRNAR
jgi:3-methylcrotonyl-CoA carboxylase alpha subunit